MAGEDIQETGPHSTPNIGNAITPRSFICVDDAAKCVSKGIKMSGADEEMPYSPGLNEKPEVNYPEGGLKAWLVVFGCWCTTLASFGVMNTFSQFQAYISVHQLANYKEGTIGWLFSVYIFLAYFLGIYIGPVFDKYGPRWLVLAGSACSVTSMMLLGICTEYWHFLLAFSFLGGIGCSLLFTPSFAVIGHYFKAKRGTATGIAATGGSMGGIIFPLLLQKTIPEVGFAWSTRIIAFIFLFICTIANILISSRLPPAENSNAHPDFRIFKSMTFLLTTIGLFLMEWGLFIPLTYISSYSLEEGFPQAFAAQIIVILNVGSVLGRWVPGYYADKIGRYNALIISIVIIMISSFAIWLPVGYSEPGLVIYALLFGFASGGGISLAPVCIGQLCETEVYGRYYATCYTIVSISCLTGVPIVGEIIERNGGKYWGTILFVGSCYAGAFVMIVAARITAKGWRLNVKF